MKEDTKIGRLTTLGGLRDYRVADGSPDIRRWEVFAADSRRIGVVRELIVDTDAMKARYMVVSLDEGLPGDAHARDALVPLGRARLDDAIDRVYVDDVVAATAHTLPRYASPLTPEREASLFGTRDRGSQEDEHARFFGRRRTDQGAAYVERDAASPIPTTIGGAGGEPVGAQPAAPTRAPHRAGLEPEVLGEGAAAAFQPGAQPDIDPPAIVTEEVIVRTTRVTVEAKKKEDV